MAAVKCPNPTCASRFDPATVPPGAVVTCPACGMRFTLGPAAPSPGPGQAKPLAKTAPRRRATMPLLIAGGGLLMVGLFAGGAFLAVKLKRAGRDPGLPADELAVPDKNFAYRMPGPPWRRDADTQAALAVTAFALRRAEPPEAWAALSVTDFGPRSPLPHELREKAAQHLQRVFNNLPEEFAFEPATWAGHAAHRAQFRGEDKKTGTVCAGECVVTSHKGIGYWWYAWAAEKDAAAVAAEVDDLRGRFRTLGDRPGWAATAGNEVSLRGTSGKYRLTAAESIWAKPAGLGPADEDPKADLLLKARLKGRGNQDYVPEATLVGLVLDAGADPGGPVRKRHTRDPELFGPTEITEVSGDPVGDSPPGPDAAPAVPVTRLRVRPGGENASQSAAKLVVFASVQADDRVIVADASCPWAEREVWERRLVQLVGSLQVP